MPSLFGWSGSSYHSAVAAFLGSCNSIRSLASQLPSVEFHELTFSDEVMAAIVFENFSSDLPISVASQHDLQAVLDQYQYDQFFASSGIREQACLTVIWN